EGGRMNLYTGLVWADVTQIVGTGSMHYDQTVAYIDASTQSGFTDWRMPNKTEAQVAAVNGYGAQFGYASTPTKYWWTSTAGTGQNQWTVRMNDPNGSASQTLRNNSILHGSMLRDTGIVIDDGSTGYSATGFSSKSTSAAYQGDQSTASSGTGS